MCVSPGLAPIVLFVYRRPRHTAATLESLGANPLARHSELYIFSDGSKGDEDRDEVAKVRKLVQKVAGFGRVHLSFRPTNLGLAENVIRGVDSVIKERGRVVVIEDDLRFSRHFLEFMNKALEVYRDSPKIFSITGYGYAPSMLSVPQDYAADVYLSHRGGSLGWATWEDRWVCADWRVGDFHLFERDRAAQCAFNRGGGDLTEMLRAQMRGDIDSWAIRWAYARFRQGGYALVPIRSYVDTTGGDGSGTHGTGGYTNQRNDLDRALANPDLPLDLAPDERILAGIRRIFAPSVTTRLRWLTKKLVPLQR